MCMFVCKSNGGLLLSRTRFEGLCHCGVRQPVGGTRSAVGRRGNTQKRQIHKRRGRGARGARGAGRAGPGPRRPLPLARTIRGVGPRAVRPTPTHRHILYRCGRLAGTSRPLLNRNTHGIEQRCIVRVECEPSYRFAYLLLPLQDVRHGDVFGEVHLAVEHDALAEDRRDVHGILVVLVAGYWNSRAGGNELCSCWRVGTKTRHRNAPGKLTSSSRSKPAAMCGGCTARQPMPALPCHGRARRLIVDASPTTININIF